ncbi:hypothetical protein CEY12_07645 [Chryseobacterium sp. T16E-39]|uniref:hypothetical protein n=1 Tax=Chryseobacterium sp. T16E-39 TaxID=2015076 RepID=UPI000B5B1FE1|nr:hypothetical protein [Chryseobacterium sp. T16E-39]ASK29988.1 hypothetical protein CEY12_07645 [Chryseobacterium sp. T16E-39]
MNENVFTERKEKLKSFLEKEFSFSGNESIAKALVILNLYNFDNRLNQKGVLSRFIIDSAEMDYSISDKIMEFDKYIT